MGKPWLQSKANATLSGLVAYLLLVLAAPVGKLAGAAHLVRLSWGSATVLVWGPWLLALGGWGLLGVVRLGVRLGKIKIHNDLTVPRR